MCRWSSSLLLSFCCLLFCHFNPKYLDQVKLTKKKIITETWINNKQEEKEKEVKSVIYVSEWCGCHYQRVKEMATKWQQKKKNWWNFQVRKIVCSFVFFFFNIIKRWCQFIVLVWMAFVQCTYFIFNTLIKTERRWRRKIHALPSTFIISEKYW